MSDNLHLDELVEIIRKGPIEEVGTGLAAIVQERMRAPRETLLSKPDDLTFVVFRP